jgi:hypothetical protein
MIRSPSFLALSFECRSLDGTKNALLQNSRFAIALRHLAASLARQGETNKAAGVMWENLAIEPELPLTKLRSQIVVLERLVLEPFPRD